MNLERKWECVCMIWAFLYLCTHLWSCVLYLCMREKGAQPVFYDYRVSFSWTFPPKHSPAASVLHSPRNGSLLNWMTNKTLMSWLHIECVCPLLWGCDTYRSGSQIYSFHRPALFLSCVLPLPAASEVGVVMNAEGVSAASDGML